MISQRVGNCAMSRLPQAVGKRYLKRYSVRKLSKSQGPVHKQDTTMTLR